MILIWDGGFFNLLRPKLQFTLSLLRYEMRRVRIVVAYDGTNYCGWQVQPNGITVEEVLNAKLQKLTG